jgi:uridine phosphorylase
LLLLRMLNGLTEINSIGNNNINSESISTILNQYTLVSYHKELPVSSEYKNDGVYVCTKGICHPIISEYSKLEELLSENLC